MSLVDLKKSDYCNKPGRTLHESVFVKILSKTLNHSMISVGAAGDEIKSARCIPWYRVIF
ncbi:hypothetical protein T11_6378 [Trichinella zimbabwensis]|uniref:Uncharacterized protein n=1 Tax=Trichinella zimbabwensis TaxID=268475 RepID=A0A0V1HXI0_9BILA|nr:hypothetical protein T11_6378 [Trichinella zimbabwensis]